MVGGWQRRVGRVALGIGLGIGAVTGFLAWAIPSLTRPKRYEDLTSPAEHGLDHAEVWFTTDDGVRLHGWWIDSPAPRGTILMCHGFGGSKDPDLAYARFLQPHFNVLMFDFRHHGRSEGDFASLGYYECRDVAAALDWLHSERGVDRVGVLGFSMGAAVAILAAAQFPRIAAVVADSGYAHLQHALAQEGRRRRFPPVMRDALAWVLAHAAARQLGFPLQHGQPIEVIHTIAPRPILIIHGDRDDLVPVADAHLLYARAGEPKALWIIPEAAHVASLATAKQVYRDRVVDFFTAQLARTETPVAAD